MNLEVNMLDLLREKSTLLSENKTKLSLVEGDLTQFINDQQKKINMLKNYLDDRLRVAINDY